MTMHWEQQYRKAVTFSYDDGNEQDEKLLEIFNDYGMKATFHVNTGLDHDHGTWQYRDRLWVHRLNLRDCPSLYRGHEVAVHGSLHQNLTELSSEALEEELGGDLRAITDIFGVYNDTVVEKLKELDLRYGRGVASSRSFAPQKDLLRFQPTCHHDDAQLFSLAEQFLAMEPETPQIFYIWGHSYEFEGNRNWDRMKRLCEMLSGKADIFYGTNAEVLLGGGA